MEIQVLTVQFPKENDKKTKMEDILLKVIHHTRNQRTRNKNANKKPGLNHGCSRKANGYYSTIGPRRLMFILEDITGIVIGGGRVTNKFTIY